MFERLQNTVLVASLAAAVAVGCAEGGPGEEPADDPASVRGEVPGGGGPIDDDDDPEPDDHPAMMPQGCPAGSCAIGDVRCEGPAVATCQQDSINADCGIWGPPTACPVREETCIAGECVAPTGCVDADGDGHGPMCAAGADCDDQEPTAYVGALELCDGIDNDCDGDVDEGYQLGMECTYGGGNCQADGTIVCGPDGGTICSGMAIGTPEVCDGVDNDCNNIVDDGVCGACQSDIFEPNDAPADAELVQVDSPKWGYTCPGDTDWFELQTQTGVSYHVYVTFPEERSDLLVRGWVDGVNVITGDTPGRDYEEFIVNGDANKTFQIEVVDRDQIESFFRIVLVQNANCFDEDGFVPNQSLPMAATLPPGWVTQAFMCAGGYRDWFSTGDLTAGEALYVGIAGAPGGTDLDLHVWGDPDGDNIFERMMSSATFDNFEEIHVPVPHDGRYYIEVVDFLGAGGAYDIGWSVQ